MASTSTKQPKKLRILLLPFFATSHIGPFTDLAFHLAAARPDTVESTVAVTPANASIVQSALARRGPVPGRGTVDVATYPFPAVDGLPPGIENLSTVKATDGWRIDAAAADETLMRPVQESIIKVRSPDVIITDMHFFWNSDVAFDLGIPCVTFHVIGAFPSMAMIQLGTAGVGDTDTATVVSIPHFPPPDISLPVTKLPEFLKNQEMVHRFLHPMLSGLKKCFGLVSNTFIDLERDYCGLFVRNGHAKSTYFVGPLALPNPSTLGSTSNSPCIEWLDTKPAQSVLYLCFGTLTHVTEAQLYELAIGLEASRKPFLWVVRDSKWSPPEGWRERVGDRGMLVAGWAPQTAILQHPAVGAFVTHCGWNSVLETVTAGVPVLTWPMVFEQFITERFVTEVLGIGERLRPDGEGCEENELIPASAIAQTVVRFMEESGWSGNSARIKVEELSMKAHAAVVEGGSSSCDLQSLIDDLMEARFGGEM
ncbi:hypothetical protein HU200_002426 [Digitaria exilis]|uniref:Glycosyltransferase n=1 Tax=Digitaria exilis TaxID=1010633 RepID=A0A835FZJ7_9POAL|nr:hypothetical protein HU200_002426 [Digitaria exilis]